MAALLSWLGWAALLWKGLRVPLSRFTAPCRAPWTPALLFPSTRANSRAGELRWPLLVVAELCPCLGPCHSVSWTMQTPSHALCRCQGCVLAAECRLSAGSVPLYPTLAPSGSSAVGSNHRIPHPGGDGHPVAWRGEPCPACSGLDTKLCRGMSPPWWSAGEHHTACAHIYPTIHTQKLFWCLPGHQGKVGEPGGSRVARAQP